ncbi:receptor-type tyrosine-protein phosphatase kappa-like [Lissotriton helveticus]
MGYQPSDSTMLCRQRDQTTQSAWNVTPTCIQKCEKSQVGNIIAGYQKEYYGDGERMLVNCSEGYEMLDRSNPYIECVIQAFPNIWQPAVPCIEKCKPPSVENLVAPNNGLSYGTGELMSVICATGHQPSHPWIQCIREGSQNVWTEDVSCLKIKEEKLTVSADRITLMLTCSNSSCDEIWDISATARQDSSGGCSHGRQSTRCIVSYNKGTVSDCTALQPSSQYYLTVHGRYKYFSQRVVLYSARARTHETVPDRPEMETKEVKIKNKTIKWKKLSDCNGVIQGYQLNITSWRDYNKTFQEGEYVTVNSSITEYTVKRPGTNYTVTIQGFTSAGPGRPLTYSFTTVISEPVIPSFIILKESNINATEKMVVLPLHPVPDIHGPISEYQIIVSRKRSMSEDICQREDLVPFNSSLDQDVYITAALPGHNLTSPEEFVLGDGTYQHGYYNAPLRAGHNYTAFLRVISIWDQDRTYSCALYGASPGAVQMKEGSSFTVFNGIQVAQIVIMLLGVMVVSLLFKSGTSQSSTLDSDEHGHTSLFS